MSSTFEASASIIGNAREKGIRDFEADLLTSPACIISKYVLEIRSDVSVGPV